MIWYALVFWDVVEASTVKYILPEEDSAVVGRPPVPSLAPMLFVLSGFADVAAAPVNPRVGAELQYRALGLAVGIGQRYHRVAQCHASHAGVLPNSVRPGSGCAVHLNRKWTKTFPIQPKFLKHMEYGIDEELVKDMPGNGNGMGSLREFLRSSHHRPFRPSASDLPRCPASRQSSVARSQECLRPSLRRPPR